MENIKDGKECFGNFAQQRIKSFATLRPNLLRKLLLSAKRQTQLLIWGE
jgi:hypothetical protein